jgi:hypothetical protein
MSNIMRSTTRSMTRIRGALRKSSMTKPLYALVFANMTSSYIEVMRDCPRQRPQLSGAPESSAYRMDRRATRKSSLDGSVSSW